MTNPYKFYAIPHSLYSGRARCYLIKAGIPFVEYSPGQASFKEDVLPKAKLATIPVLVTPENDVIRDSTRIIDHFEQANGQQFQPLTAKQKTVSAIFDLIGTDGLLRPVMHYRWNYPAEHEQFLHYHFLHSQRIGDTREEKTRYMMGKMQHAGAMFGVGESSKDLIESLYTDLLIALNQHFESTPYLLGWKPSIADFGLITPLYAHLGRDPVPVKLMQEKALRVFRWVERMNRFDDDASEYFDRQQGYLTNDEIPLTLCKVLQIIAEDLIPETTASAEIINNWLATNQPEAGTTVERFFEASSFEVRGEKITAISQSYRFYMLQRIQDIYQALSDKERAEVETLLQHCNLLPLLKTKLSRRIGWSENLPVWGE